MVAELLTHDRLVMHKVGGWHGLGKVLQQDIPVREAAFEVFGVEGTEPRRLWGVKKKNLFTINGQGKRQVVEGAVALFRDDLDLELGVVTRDYQIVQPADMADFCEALRDEGGVMVETAGTIRNGKRGWFLLKGREFEVAKGDKVCDYLGVSNGWDGGTTFRVTPTNVRWVCSNTFHMDIPQWDTGELRDGSISVRHTGDVMAKVREVQRALAHFGKVSEENVKLMETLASKPVNHESVQKFFLECYTAEIGEIPENPQDKYEQRRRDKAMSAYNSFCRRFDDEKEVAGASYWNCFNAFSGLVQHDMKARGKDDADRVERRVESNLFGLGAKRTQAALKRAFKLAAAT